MGKFERGKHELSARLGLRRFPAEPAGNHQVNDDEELVFAPQHNPLAQPLKTGHSLSLIGGRRRLYGSQDERAANNQAEQLVAQNAGRQLLQVQGDVGKLGHGGCAADITLYLEQDRKSTRLNSSHPSISYAVFCLKKKKKRQQ